MRRPFFGGGPFGGAGFAIGGPGALGAIGNNGVVHASYTVKDGDGNYETIDTQVGTAETVTSSSITVKSADGFSQTYEVGSGTVVNADYEGILSVNQGDQVTVEAVVNGSTVTAERVMDLTQLQANRQAWVPGAGAPSTTSTTDGGDPSAA